MARTDIDLEERLGVRFRQKALLWQALTHTSYANEHPGSGVEHNERLEFLGDAVLELATSQYLYQRYPGLPEGDLTRARASIVCEETLSRHALALGLGDCLLLGHGEWVNGGSRRPSILADTFESVLGALYLDQGWESARDCVWRQLAGELADSRRVRAPVRDYKTQLQELVQRQPGQSIAYRLLETIGPDHDRQFRVAVLVNGEALGTGLGRSKKIAEQAAAESALGNLAAHAPTGEGTSCTN